MSRGGVAAGSESGSTAHSGPENAAWAQADLPLPAQDVFIFLADIERLFRLNPHLEISGWHDRPGERGACGFRALNETNGCHHEVAMRLAGVRENRRLMLLYDGGLKAATEFRIEPAGAGATLTITEHYHPLADQARLNEVDRSLVPWLAAIRRHLVGLARYGWLPGYRWWVERVMPSMPPRQRRIVRMIAWISLFEFLAFVFVATIFWLERQGG